MVKASVHKSNGRRGRGAPGGNRNAVKSLAWLDEYDLSSSPGVRGFLQEIIHRTWTGELGSRQAGALNGTMRLLLEHDLLPELEKRIRSLEDNKGMRTN
jgi:hypothetical protein